MKRIDNIFHLHRAKSKLFSDYEPGDIAYVGNGLSDNAVVGFVKPFQTDRVFAYPAIAVSAFCESTVQVLPFVACGRAGNGLVVLQPREEMCLAQLAYISAYINEAVGWRFNWYRQVTADRISSLLIPETYPTELAFDLESSLPTDSVRILADNEAAKTSIVSQNINKLKTKSFAIGDLYDLKPGDFHSAGELPAGKTPLVSCGDAENGVTRFVDAGSKTYRNKITIAFNGMNTLSAKYHPYLFAAKDDVAICEPSHPMLLSTEIFIMMMINRERWRYSYYRKCFADKLKRFRIELPAKHSAIDEGAILSMVKVSKYWPFVEAFAENNADKRCFLRM